MSLSNNGTKLCVITDIFILILVKLVLICLIGKSTVSYVELYRVQNTLVQTNY